MHTDIFVRMIRLALFATSIALGTLSSHAQVSIAPANPKQLETVRVQIAPGGLGADTTGFPDSYSAKDTQIMMVGNTITVSLLMVGNNGLAETPSPPVDLPIGQFPPGSYQVEVVKRATGAGRAGAVGSGTFSVTPRATTDPLWNYTDMWWNSRESGWGLNIVQHGGNGQIFATWFVYGVDGKPIWYAIPGGVWASETSFHGTVYRTSGPYFGGPFDPSLVTVTQVGTAAIGFASNFYDRASAVITVDGLTTIKDLTRLPF